VLRFVTALMNYKRTAKIALAVAAVAAWLAAAVTTGPRPSADPSAPKGVALDQHSAGLAKEIATLHQRLTPAAAVREPKRNLFSFGQPKRIPAPHVESSRPALSEANAAAFAPPPLKLTGIAEDVRPEGTVRTAVISGLGQLFLVKEGENIGARYRVAKISSEVVEIADLNGGPILRLALK
jgi:hypothetical protein